MIFRITGLLLILLTGFVTARAEPISRREVLAAIAVLEKDVTSDEALKAAETVTRFGKESEEVLLIVGEDTLPWVQENPPEGEAAARMMLMAVYFAGDIKSQLQKRRAEDDPYSGWLAAIRGYRLMRKKQPGLVIAEIEELIKKEAAGTLQQEAEDLRKQQEQDEKQERAKNIV